MKIAVVGLGVAGLSVCARLAEAGHDVDGFEQFPLMHAQGSSHGDTRIFRLTPGEGEIYVRLVERAHPLWKQWESANGGALIQWRDGLMVGPPGSKFVASCAALSEASGSEYALMRGENVESFTRGAIRLPADWEVCRQADCGVILADATREFLIRHAQKWGARLHADTRVSVDGTRLVIDGAARSYDAAIISAGAWTAKLVPDFARLLAVKRRVVAWFSARDGAGPVPIICADDGGGLFGMPTPDGSYKIGLHTVGETVDPDHVRDTDNADAALLADKIAAHFPLHDPHPTAMTRCLYTVTPDENFLIAPSPAHERMLVMSCCSGHGFKYAPMFGEIALDWLEGRGTPAAFGIDGRAGAASALGREA